MSTLHSFSQGELLERTTSDPDIRGGVCVAMCAYWLERMKVDSDRAPEQRLRMLERQIWAIIGLQQQYSRDRSEHGPQTAHQILGARQGLVYDTDQTEVFGRFLGLGRADGIANLIRQFKKDINRPGKATAWSLRFVGGGGHAIAGFCNITIVPNGYRYQLHVFDPNVGEYVGTLQEIDEILNNLFRRPFYRRHRVDYARRVLVGVF